MAHQVYNYASRPSGREKAPFYATGLPSLGRKSGLNKLAPETLGDLVDRHNHNQKDWEGAAGRGKKHAVGQYQKTPVLDIGALGVNEAAIFVPNPVSPVFFYCLT